MINTPLFLVILALCGMANSVQVKKEADGSKFLQIDNQMTQDLSTKLLTQADLNQVKLSLAQSSRCQSQATDLAKRVLLNQNYKGKHYNFSMAQPLLKEFRVAFAGDSITWGYAGSSLEEILGSGEKYRLSDNSKGVVNNHQFGYPSLTYQLLQDNNKTQKYSFFNYAVNNGKLYEVHDPEWPDTYYPENCRAEQMNKSLAHVVVMAFGGPDSTLDQFNEDEWIQKYVSYIKQVQSLPQKPIVMLVVPTFTLQTLNDGKGLTTNPNDPVFPAFTQKNVPMNQRIDMQRTIYKVANMSGIPDHHVVNAWYLLRLNRKIAARELFIEDNAHPNKRGFGIIAQDLFMKMSESPEILHREFLVQNGMDEDWNNAIRAQLRSQMEQDEKDQKKKK